MNKQFKPGDWINLAAKIERVRNDEVLIEVDGNHIWVKAVLVWNPDDQKAAKLGAKCQRTNRKRNA